MRPGELIQGLAARQDPLAAYNFRVVLGTQTLGFSKVSGLQRAHKTIPYRHGRSFLEGPRVAVVHDDEFVAVTLERGVIVGVRQLHAWFDARGPRALTITMCDATGAAALVWTIARAYPVKLTAPTFDAGTSEVAIETLEIQASGISVKPS